MTSPILESVTVTTFIVILIFSFDSPVPPPTFSRSLSLFSNKILDCAHFVQSNKYLPIREW